MKPIPTFLLISICVVTAVYWDDKPKPGAVSVDDWNEKVIQDTTEMNDVYDELRALQMEVGQLRRRVEKLEAK